ncbi:MAG: NAD-dependent dehydratase [Xanthomonadales bacterium]|nr:NAD-dependent dehydratase [Xanthomonadales bacterium]
MSASPVLLLGASSQIGRFAVPRLVRLGAEVYAVSRSGRPQDYPALPGVRWLRPEEGTKTREDVSGGCLVSTGPIRLAVEALRAGHKPGRVIAFSTTSVFSKPRSGDRHERETIRHIRQMEASLHELCQARGIALAIFRPTLVYGCGLDQSVTLIARWADRLGWVPVARASAGLRQPVHADDLASAVVAAVGAPVALHVDTPLCGGEALSFSDMVARVVEALDKPVRLVRLPTWMFAFAVRVAGVMPGLRGLNPEMVRRQALDMVFDDTLARTSLAYRPRPFQPTRADFLPPTTELIAQLASGTAR